MTSRRAKLWLFLWLVLAGLWIGGTTYSSLQSWPRVPLDVSRNDPQVQAAYSAAVNRHRTRTLLIAVTPPLVLLVLGFIAGGLSSRKSG